MTAGHRPQTAESGPPSSVFFRFGLTGFPLTHSLSPRLHTAALQALGLEGEYSLFPIPPLPEGSAKLQELLGSVHSGELHGLNVTVPHKRAVLPWLDELTPIAQAVGAVNTIFCRDGRLVGDNTDAAGFLADVQFHLERLGKAKKRFTLKDPKMSGERTFDPGETTPSQDPGKTALVLGAGGAARAVTYALSADGWQVFVAARRFEQAQALAGGIAISLSEGPLSTLYSRLSLLVNATPLGMAPYEERSPWPEGAAFPQGAVVYDLVYNPPETVLMRQARAAGLPVLNGLGMLVEQAAMAFERWTGTPAPRQAMREAVSDGEKDG